MPEAGGSIPKHCVGTRRDGQSCTAPVLGPSPYCFAHDPHRAAERQQARQRGGQQRSNAARLGALCPLRLLATFDKLEAALEEVHDYGPDPRQATAMAALAGVMVRVLQAGELEDRLRVLERRRIA